jgi:hypothetical protein
MVPTWREVGVVAIAVAFTLALYFDKANSIKFFGTVKVLVRKYLHSLEDNNEECHCTTKSYAYVCSMM